MLLGVSFREIIKETILILTASYFSNSIFVNLWCVACYFLLFWLNVIIGAIRMFLI